MLRRLAGLIKAGVKRLLLSLGYSIVRAEHPMHRCTMEGALRALANRKHAFNAVIVMECYNFRSYQRYR